MEANIYVILLSIPTTSNGKNSLTKCFLALHCETQAAWENLFFPVPIIKLRMFGGYFSVIGAFKEAEIQVISICALFSEFSY